MNVRIYTLLSTVVVLLATQTAAAQRSEKNHYHVIPFGQGGQHKMLYDRRQRPQAVLAANKLHLVYNGGTPPNVKNIAGTMPFALTYDLETGQCSDPFQLPGTASRDHHYGPIIWAGAEDRLHVLSGCHKTPGMHVLTENTVHELNYYYVHRVEDRWEQVVIAPARHKWNSSHLMSDQNGVLLAFLPMTDGSFDSKGKGPMNNHGGGTRIEEWTSEDEGRTWKKHRALLTAEGRYRGWRFNNVQPVRTTTGEVREGLLLCYGWKDGEASQARAFVLVRDDQKPQ